MKGMLLYLVWKGHVHWDTDCDNFPSTPDKIRITIQIYGLPSHPPDVAQNMTIPLQSAPFIYVLLDCSPITYNRVMLASEGFRRYASSASVRTECSPPSRPPAAFEVGRTQTYPVRELRRSRTRCSA